MPYNDKGKKIICCASLVKDLIEVEANVNMTKTDEVCDSKEAQAFIEAADALAELLK